MNGVPTRPISGGGAMSFTGSLQTFARRARSASESVFVSTAVEMPRSVKFGSELTGAPADAGRAERLPARRCAPESITLTFPDENTALIYTTKPYALDVEDNAKGHTFNTGGPHGWKLTQAAFPRIVESTAQRIAGGGA
jgi:hypothetical protein